MNYKVEFHKTVQKFFQKHTDATLLRKFKEAIDELKCTPRTSEIVDIKKMQGSENDYRLRIGKYRFLYRVLDEQIVVYVYDAGSRGDIYK